MNIKLDKDVRIRLDQEDIQLWKSNMCLEQEFKLGLQNFLITLRLDSEVFQPHVVNKMDSLTVVLGDKESAQLCDETQTLGIVVDDVTIQIDKWNAKTRNKYENHIKSR